MRLLYLLIPFAPLVASIVVGLWGPRLGRGVSHWLCILGVAASFVASIVVARDVQAGNVFNGDIYAWLQSGTFKVSVGFLLDPLTTTMMLVVTFVSLMVHIYTIGYMADDDGYTRFFSYISLFTFSMLMLVMSNNFVQLFFGWEAVGLVSYLLIGFWYTRPTAIYANLKAFLANRVGDFGFVLGIGLVLAYFGTLDYAPVFAKAESMAATTIVPWGGAQWSLMSAICICLFIGAMGKSAQVPLHVWLPDSMEGPTPISALIHAATMVTAGIFMVARMSPMFELSETALQFVLFIGATTAFFTGLMGIVQNDIKRVVAYSTLSQLGYMTVALGASAYSVAVFHLMTHAFFKALLFLAAGSVIIGMHHEQDMRRMGGLRKYMPITYWTCLIGFPGFSGFFSKDIIIESLRESSTDGAGYAYWCALIGVFVTALYSFRLVFMTFHGKERMDEHTREHLHESPWVVTVPLVALAIPSIAIGWLTVGPVVFGDFFAGAIAQSPHGPIAMLGLEFHGPAAFVLHALEAPALYLALGGVLAAWYLYLKRPELPDRMASRYSRLYRLLVNKYYFDWFNENVIATGVRNFGASLWKRGDETVIDGWLVNGSARAVAALAALGRHLQSGYLYHYAFAMIIGLSLLLGWLLWRS